MQRATRPAADSTEAQLRELTERLGLALSAAQAGDWSWDARTDVLTLSERAARIFGVTPGPQMKWSAMLSLLHDDDVERVRAAAARSVAQRERYDVEYRIPHLDGRELWIASQAIPHCDANGELLGMFGVVQDITARKRMEGELRRRADELAQADHRKNEFLATLAHELRNPLAPLRNALELLGRPGVPVEMAERARLIMSRQVAQMARLVDELVDISRMSSGRIELKRERVALQTQAPLAPVQPPQRHRVLVADDHELVRQSFVELLESEGHEVRTAADGESALAIAREWRPNFVLLDVHMPGISGLDAARRLRALFTPQQMTLVMLSGLALNDAWREQARAAGFDDCVDKTADPARLLERLRTQFAVATGDAP